VPRLATARKLLHELVSVKMFVVREHMLDQRQPLLRHPHALALQVFDKAIARRKGDRNFAKRRFFSHSRGIPDKLVETSEPAMIQNFKEFHKTSSAASINKIVPRPGKVTRLEVDLLGCRRCAAANDHSLSRANAALSKRIDEHAVFRIDRRHDEANRCQSVSIGHKLGIEIQ